MPKFTNLLSVFLILCLSITISSCNKEELEVVDRETKLTQKGYRDFFVKKKNKNRKESLRGRSSRAAIPKMSKLILTPPPPKIGGNKTISFSVTDQVPLKDVLIELGRVSKIDVDIDPTISGGIILNAKNRPLKEVIERIANLGKLRYSYKNGVLRFEKDSPYLKNYFVDFLSESQLWSDVETNLTAILDPASAETTSDTSSDLLGDDLSEDIAPAAASSSISSNKSAGIITVRATQAEHKEIAKYLDDVYKVASTQVLIEAKVVEVTLNEDYQAGIDWSWNDGTKSAVTSFGNAVTNPELTVTTPHLLGIGRNIGAVIQALEKFGTARAISSPRISAMNNQKAVLDFSENLVYFTISSSSATSSGTATATTVQTVTATKNEVPVGVQLTIIPSVNITTKEITLDIQPKLSVDSGQDAIDPSVDADGKNLGNLIPIIRSREIQTIAKVQSGEILVVGGLMTEKSSNEDNGVPFLSRIPFLGHLFKFTGRSSSIVETVIFVKATIVNNGTPPATYDRDFYDKFTVDRKEF